MNDRQGAIRNARLCTFDGATGFGLVEHGAVAWRDGLIQFVGADTDLPGDSAPAIDAGGALLTPGLIDCHTHLVFAGQRSGEFEARLAGASYVEIARAGGGIAATVRATREASEDALYAASLPRARALRDEGVTTLEVKSGYGLDLESEARMLRVARRIGAELGIGMQTTALCAHAVPPEFSGDAEGYIDRVCGQILPALAAEGLADAVDAFCEGIGFTPAQTRRVFDTAAALGLPVKLHADQLSDLGGAALVAQYRGLSADHVEFSSPASITEMAAAGVVAVLLPGAFYALRETRRPPVDGFRERGVAMAVATDLNPGTSPLTSLRLAMNMACVLFELTVEEAWRGATVNAARALGLADRGRLRPGLRADLVLWPVNTAAEVVYWIGGMAPRAVIAGGRQLSPG